MVHEVVAFLLARQPPQARIVLSTRADLRRDRQHLDHLSRAPELVFSWIGLTIVIAAAVGLGLWLR